MFTKGFEKISFSLFGKSKLDETAELLHTGMGSKYDLANVRSYTHSLGLDKVDNINTDEARKDVKDLYDKKLDYEKSQKGLLATAPGSDEEKDYLKKNKKALDSKLLSWSKQHIQVSKKHKTPHQDILAKHHGLMQKAFKS